MCEFSEGQRIEYGYGGPKGFAPIWALEWLPGVFVGYTKRRVKVLLDGEAKPICVRPDRVRQPEAAMEGQGDG